MKQSLFKPALLCTAAILLVLIACKKDPAEGPAPQPVDFLLRQIKWSDNDHLTFIYNEKGQLEQLRNQWQYVEGDPTKTKTIIDDFIYDAQGKLIQVNTDGGLKALYFYKDDRIEKIQELLGNGTVVTENTYLYDKDRIVGQIKQEANAPGEPPTVYQYLYEFDANNNLTKVAVYIQPENPSPGKPFELVNTTEYSDFDNKINPAGWMLQYPYLPHIRLQYNNPRKQVYRPVGGMVQTTTYEYEYNEKGLPLAKHQSGPGGVLNAAYQY